MRIDGGYVGMGRAKSKWSIHMRIYEFIVFVRIRGTLNIAE